MKIRSFLARFGAIAAAASALMAPVASHAESNYQTGLTGTLTATARLDFSVTVERFLFLRVGTGTAQANNTAVDLVNFAVTGANNGSGTAVAGSQTVAAQVKGNGGNVSFSNTTPGALSNGTQSISYATISASAVALAGSGTVLAHPTFVNGASSTVANLAATGNVVDAGATWTFNYSNAALVAAGTYGATAANNGRVTYTAVNL